MDTVFAYRVGSTNYPAKIVGPFDAYEEASVVKAREGRQTGRIRKVTIQEFRSANQKIREGRMPAGW